MFKTVFLETCLRVSKNYYFFFFVTLLCNNYFIIDGYVLVFCRRAKVKVPTACVMFPNEFSMLLNLKILLKRKFTNLVRAPEMKKGGHFAAFEQPKLLADDIWLTVIEMETIRNR